MKQVQILLVEDNPADVELTKEAFKQNKIYNNLLNVSNGEEALEVLRNSGKFNDYPSIDLILLDLNLPKKDGREVLKEIKNDDQLRIIPVVILTTSDEISDINGSYSNYASAYIQKPVDFEQFVNVVQHIDGFWLTCVKLPENSRTPPR